MVFFLFMFPFFTVVDMKSSVPVPAVMDRASYSVRTSTDGPDGRDYLYARQFSLMQCCDGDHVLFEALMDEERLSGAGVWARRQERRDGKGVISSSTLGTRSDLHFVQCVAERDYERQLSNLMDAHFAGEVDELKLLLCLFF